LDPHTHTHTSLWPAYYIYGCRSSIKLYMWVHQCVWCTRLSCTYLPIILIFYYYVLYYVTAATASLALHQQHNAFPFQRFGRVFSVIIVIFYGPVFRRLSGGDAQCTGGTNRGRRRNAERGPPLLALRDDAIRSASVNRVARSSRVFRRRCRRFRPSVATVYINNIQSYGDRSYIKSIV